MALKTNLSYKPTIPEANRFFETQLKDGFATTYVALGTMLRLEYPALSDAEIIKYLKIWYKSQKNPSEKSVQEFNPSQKTVQKEES